MPRRVTEERVKGEQGNVRVRREEGDVLVVWHCGEDYAFKPERLRELIEYVDEFADFKEVWAQLRAGANQRFVARLDGDRLLVGREIDSVEAFPWDPFKGALLDAADAVEAEVKANGDGGAS